MNRDEIIEAEVEKAEQRYAERAVAFVRNRFSRVVDPLGVAPRLNMDHLRMDLADIAQLYGFDPATGKYVLDAGGWYAPIDTIWSLPEDIFSPSAWLSPELLRERIDNDSFLRDVEQRSAGAIHDPRFQETYIPKRGDALYDGTKGFPPGTFVPIEELS